MREFAEDLKRFLANESIMARPPNRVQKLWRIFQCHRNAMLATISLLFALMAGTLAGLVMVDRKTEELRSIEARFQPMEEAFEWFSYADVFSTDNWLRDIDPDEPAGCLFAALRNIGGVDQLWGVDLNEAEKHLEECLNRCELKKDEMLLNETHYLLALVKRRMAEESNREPAEKDVLLHGAEAELELAGSFDPASGNFFIWRPGGKDWHLRKIRLNTEHFLVHLIRGLYPGLHLYKGGKKREFDCAFNHLEAVLRKRPDHLTAMAAIGRIYLFYARAYDRYDLLDKVENLMNQVLEASGERSNQIIYTTLGQSRLLRGDFKLAIDYFRRALHQAAEDDPRIHNAYCGLGMAFTRLDKPEEAFLNFSRALERQPTDAHTNTALAECYLKVGESDKALTIGQQAVTPSILSLAAIRENRIASAYVICARAAFAQADKIEGIKELIELTENAVLSPHDLCLGCFVSIAFTDFLKTDNLEKPIDPAIEELTKRTVTMALNASFEAPESPLCLSARGVIELSNSNYSAAIRLIEEAMKRRKTWPEDVQEYRKHQQIWDFYLQAIAHYGLYQEDQSRKSSAIKSWRCFASAESIYRENKKKVKFVEYWDILEAIRDKASRMLNSEKHTSKKP
ncbi:MAG: tetratricopeptide repeat protein [Planctomycetota bacterium]